MPSAWSPAGEWQHRHHREAWPWGATLLGACCGAAAALGATWVLERARARALGASSLALSSAPAPAAPAASSGAPPSVDADAARPFAFEVQAAALDKAAVLAARRALCSGAQSVSYANSDPLMVVQGRSARLVDERGLEFLDTRNNVGHIGWQHPRWLRAVSRQLSQTNSNTRYLHPLHALLSRKLLDTMPGALSAALGARVFFVNSGSEANELALRLARAHTRRRHCVVVERAYHGHTCCTVELSPYKFLGQGGEGQPEWVSVVPCPDAYRARRPGEELPAFAERMAGAVAAACQAAAARGAPVCAFFLESGMSVAGVVLPPPGYLAAAYRAVRAAGGLCVADEVQVGLGRLGEHFWGFQQQGVVPDVVTMGKPFGNGFPLAAVVCTAEVARSFVNGMEYFSTFGGNPVACAAGLAVLETIEAEGLQAHAARVGERLRTALRALADTPAGALVGDVRGAGLFIGVELVSDRATKQPASKETSLATTLLVREHRILTSVDGAHDNVIVITPPMTFSESDADRFVAALADVLAKVARADLGAVQHTPT